MGCPGPATRGGWTPPAYHTSPRSWSHIAIAPAPTVWYVVRDILSADLTLTADKVITTAKTKGLTVPDAVIRGTVHTVRKKLKKKAAAPTSKKAPVAARMTVAPEKPAVVVAAPMPAAGLANVLSNIALVNAAVAASGGVEQVRQVAEAVRACGGPDQFAQYLDLVAGIRTN